MDKRNKCKLHHKAATSQGPMGPTTFSCPHLNPWVYFGGTFFRANCHSQNSFQQAVMMTMLRRTHMKTTHQMLAAKGIRRSSNAVVTAAIQECIPEHFDTTDSVCKAVHHSQMVGQQRNEHPHHTPQQEAATQPRPSTGGGRPTAVNSSSASHATAVYYAAIMHDIGNTYASALHKKGTRGTGSINNPTTPH